MDDKNCNTCKYGPNRKQETCEGCSVGYGRWIEADWHKTERTIKDMDNIPDDYDKPFTI